MADLKAALRLLKGAGITIPKKKKALKGGALEIIAGGAGDVFFIRDTETGQNRGGPYRSEREAQIELARMEQRTPSPPRQQQEQPQQQAPRRGRVRGRLEMMEPAQREQVRQRLAEANARFQAAMNEDDGEATESEESAEGEESEESELSVEEPASKRRKTGRGIRLSGRGKKEVKELKAILKQVRERLRVIDDLVASKVKTARELRQLDRGTGPLVDDIAALETEKEELVSKMKLAEQRLQELKRPPRFEPTMEPIAEEEEPREPLSRAEMGRLASEFARKLPQLKGKGLEKHIKAYAASLKGGSRNSGFIQRMMAEVKKKHDGEYKNPTAPLAADTEMNAPVAFDYFAMPKESREMSKFIMDHFFKIRPYRAGERAELNEYELKKLRDAEAERQRRSRARRRGGVLRGGSEDTLATFLEGIRDRMNLNEEDPNHLSNEMAWEDINDYLDENDEDAVIFDAIVSGQEIENPELVADWIEDAIEYLRDEGEMIEPAAGAFMEDAEFPSGA